MEQEGRDKHSPQQFQLPWRGCVVPRVSVGDSFRKLHNINIYTHTSVA